MQDKILNANDAAELLTISKKRIEKAFRENEIRARKAFGKWYVLESTLIDFIKEGNSIE